MSSETATAGTTPVRTAVVVRAAIADAALIVLFVILGRKSHHEDGSFIAGKQYVDKLTWSKGLDPKTGKRIIMAHPAYDQTIKASHLFNLLDARGVISVTERAAYIGRIRQLARSVAQSYLESRQQLGFPMAPKLWAEESMAKDARA